MKIKKLAKKYHKKVLAVGTAISGIYLVDQTVKATRKVAKKASNNVARTMVESTLQVAGTLAWMTLAYKLWNAENDAEPRTDEQILTVVRSSLVNRLTQIKDLLGDPDRDGGKLADAIYDVKEAYETGRLMPNEIDVIDLIYHLTLGGEFTLAQKEVEKLIERVATGEMHFVPEEDDQEEAQKVDSEKPTVGESDAADLSWKDKIENRVVELCDKIRAGEMSALDAADAIGDLMEELGVGNDDLLAQLSDHFSDVAEAMQKDTKSSSGDPADNDQP